MESYRQSAQETEYSLTASHLLEYLFCPRFTYFEYVLDIPQHEEKRFKVEVGRKIHEKKMNPEYLRKKLGVTEKKD
jgi:CRISPR-associated exonuclease Cas4